MYVSVNDLTFTAWADYANQWHAALIVIHVMYNNQSMITFLNVMDLYDDDACIKRCAYVVIMHTMNSAWTLEASTS